MLSNEKNVEMDPASAAQVKQRIDQRRQEILGWYHSHPFFEAQPSNIDIQNHRQYQNMFEKDQKKFFIGSIISPYFHEASRLKRDALKADWSELCDTLCYQLEKKTEGPFALKYKLMPECVIKKRVLDDMLNMCRRYMETFTNVKLNFKDKMRGFTSRVNYGQKFILVILQLLLDNLKLLNDDIDGND